MAFPMNPSSFSPLRVLSSTRTALVATMTFSVTLSLAFSVAFTSALFAQSVVQSGSQPSKPSTGAASSAVAGAAQSGQQVSFVNSSSQSITLATSTGTLSATLEMPVTPGPMPVVLVVYGGIPIDRNGNSHLFNDSNNTVKLICEALWKQGIATLRYDKRGVGQSKGACLREEELRAEVYAQDAIGWGKKLQTNKLFSAVYVLGHGESAVPAMVAARVLGADGLMIVSAHGRAPQEIMLDKAKGLPPELSSEMRSAIASLEQGKRVDSLQHPLLYMNLRPTVQPYLISMFRYQPAKELAKFSAASLVLGGARDVDITPNEVKQLLANSNSQARFVAVDNMNHALREAASPEERLTGMAGKSRSAAMAAPIAPKLISEIAEFVRVNTFKKKIRETAKAQQ
jgi:uncharacterized protein